jgi:transcription antitermination protein NusB
MTDKPVTSDDQTVPVTVSPVPSTGSDEPVVNTTDQAVEGQDQVQSDQDPTIEPNEELTDTPADGETTAETEDKQPKAIDPRHQRRQELMQRLFTYSFIDHSPGVVEQFEAEEEWDDLLATIPEIDTEVQAAATERPLTEINKVDLAILRLIMFESKRKKTPKKVLINEGIELAKEFGTESSPKFVNGVLAKLFEL